MSKLHGFEMFFIDPSEFSHFALPSYKEVKLAFPYGISRKIEDIRPDYIHIATEGPIDVVENGKTGFLDDNLDTAIQKCLRLGRVSSKVWSWESCWEIFERNLIRC